MGVTEAQPMPTDDAIAIEVVATTICDRVAVCTPGGLDDGSTGACMKQAREAVADDLQRQGGPCARAVETEPLNRCLADLAKRPCSDTSRAVATVPAARAAPAAPSCEAAKLCP